MKLTTKDLAYLEKLSRIGIATKAKNAYLKKLSAVIGYVSQLASVQVEGIQPTSQVTNLENVLREDIVKPSMLQEDVLANSKHTLKGYFKVPKVVEQPL